MSNKEIYKKTLTFSLHRFLFNTCALIGVGLLAVGGFILMDKLTDKGLIGLAIGVLFGIVIVAVVAHFFAYTFQAGQIAMMTRAVTEGTLPDDVYAEGKRMVKERFTTVAIYYAATNAIKAIGGDAGNAIASTINIGIQVLIGFLCDCCLGWVFYCKDKSALKATLQGAAIFFKNGKTLLRNMGRIFGMGIASLVLIGGAFSGVFFLIFSNMTDTFTSLRDELVEACTRNDISLNAFFTNPTNLALIAAVIVGIILWAIVHGTFVRPFVLVGVLRNFTQAGLATKTTEQDYEALTSKSKKFRKLQEKDSF